jgi:anti-sigma regulatory factor (Ser/Thr protein kinase)
MSSNDSADNVQSHERVYLIERLEEHVVLEEFIGPLVNDVAENVIRILDYSCTEILNNAIDHSEGLRVKVGVNLNQEFIEVFIVDNGIGIFNKIQRVLKLDSPHEAIVELCKGKLTTDPDHHTGEGIFFTSQACDKFYIISSNLTLYHDDEADWLIEKQTLAKEGTVVILQINRNSRKELNEVFAQFTTGEPEDFGFTRTRFPISIAEYGPDGLTSRSKAKRILNRISKFKEVILNFQGVESVGQAFADEIFRVFKRAHPEVHLEVINANDNIKEMIKRAQTSNIQESKEPKMPVTRTILRVFVGSPGDMTPERAALDQVVNELNRTWGNTSRVFLELIKWETHGYPGIADDSQAVINEELLNDYDIFIGLMWTRFGTPTNRAGSGTEEEFDRAYEQFKRNPKQIRVMFYFKEAPVAPLALDPAQLVSIKNFRDQLGEKGALYWTFNESDEFARLARIHLSLALQDYGKGWGIDIEADAKSDKRDVISTEVEVAGENSVDQDDVVELGLIELWEAVQENNEVYLEVMARITEATHNIGERITERTKELNDLQASGAGFDVKQVKRITNRTAEDMTNYADILEIEVPIMAKSFSALIDQMSISIPLAKDFGGFDYQTIRDLNKTIANLKDTVFSSQAQLRGYRDAVASTPRATTALNHAKKRVVSNLNRMDEELSASFNLLSELGKALDDLEKGMQDKKNGNGPDEGKKAQGPVN